MNLPAKRHICFYAPKAYPVLANNDNPGYGGAEVKQVFFARALVSVGYRVSFLTNDSGQPDKSQICGISIINLNSDKGSNQHGTFYRTNYNLWRAMSAVNADVFIQRAAGPVTGVMAAFCKMAGRHFIYFVASSYDVDGGYIKQSSLRNRLLFKYGLAQSSLIIVQARSFGKILLANHRLRSTFIQDGHDIPKSVLPFEDRSSILYIGATRPVKRPELFIELASKCPELSFVFIGGPMTDRAYHERIKNMAAKVENLDFTGHLPRSEIGKYLSRAKVLVNTSEREGLPNTVTEAWSHGTPVVGLSINPDSLLDGQLGHYCEHDFELMVVKIRELEADRENWTSMSLACRKYAINNHNIDDVRTRFAEAIENLSTQEFKNVGRKTILEVK